MNDAIVLLNRSRRFSDDSGIGNFARLCNTRDFDLTRATEALTHASNSDVQVMRQTAQRALPPPATAMAMDHVVHCVAAANRGPQTGQTWGDFATEILQLWQGFQILCAHRRGLAGVTGVQEHLLRHLEQHIAQAQPSDPLFGLDLDRPHWVGRPVMIRQNDPASGRYNGDVGVVLPSPSGTVQVAFAQAQGEVAWLPTARLPYHQTVLAMTIHKSQGSEYPTVMVVLPGRISPVLTRELINTGVTRAQNRVILCANEAILRSALTRQVQRVSGLRDALWSSG